MTTRLEIFEILQYMDKNSEPVGSGKACEVLQAAGFQVSEATVGRLLRSMDIAGLTECLGFKGRVLTRAGKQKLESHRSAESRMRYSRQLADMVRSRSLEELLEVLVARRAIEREIARLAALNATEEQIAALEKLAGMDSPVVDNIAQDDVSFHQVLSDAAGNKVLAAALILIRQDAQLAPVLGYIRQQVHGQVFADHKKVLKAVLNGDALAAEEAMVTHIDNLIRDVKKYWARFNGSKQQK